MQGVGQQTLRGGVKPDLGEMPGRQNHHPPSPDAPRPAGRLHTMTGARVQKHVHRRIVQASGNPVVAMLWEALARHVLIVFGREIRGERNSGLAEQHTRLRDILMEGSDAALDGEIEQHIMRLQPAGR